MLEELLKNELVYYLSRVLDSSAVFIGLRRLVNALIVQILDQEISEEGK